MIGLRSAPIRLRLTLAFTAAMAVVFALLAWVLYMSMSRALLDEVDRGLRTVAQTIAADVSTNLSPSTPLIERDETFAQILATDGRVIQTTPGFARSVVDPAGVDRPTFLEQRVGGIDGMARIFVVPVRRSSVVVVAGSSLQDRADAMRTMTYFLAAGGPVALALASFAGWLVAGFALRPVERMRSEASAISASELDKRLEEPEANDEIRRLATTLNAMLGRLEESITGERRFLDNASHELRTPLTVLKTELDVALARPRNADELTSALRSASEETDRLARMAEDLLVLSRMNNGRLPVHREETALRPLLEASSRMFAGRAEAAGVRIQVDAPEATVLVDGSRIRQAVDNLIDNAIRVTPAGGVVGVHARLDEGRVTIAVEDQGPGFPRGFVQDAFEPFRRAPVGTGDGEVDGAGLGLAIVKAIAESHGGTATAENLPSGGARVSLFCK
jgi:heavy metal sensor kinase